jgi:hypothetical protein
MEQKFISKENILQKLLLHIIIVEALYVLFVKKEKEI